MINLSWVNRPLCLVMDVSSRIASVNNVMENRSCEISTNADIFSFYFVYIFCLKFFHFLHVSHFFSFFLVDVFFFIWSFFFLELWIFWFFNFSFVRFMKKLLSPIFHKLTFSIWVGRRIIKIKVSKIWQIGVGIW